MAGNDIISGLRVDDLLLDQQLISRLQTWIDSREAGITWVTGHRGTGISTMIRILVKDMDVVWIATSTPWSRQFFVLATSTSSVLRPKIVVIEEFDEVLLNEVMHADLAALIKSKPKLPILCVGHHRTGRAASLCRGALEFHFPAVSSATLASYLEARGLASSSNAHKASSTQSIDVGQALVAGRYNSSHTDVSLNLEDTVHAILNKKVQFLDALRLYDHDSGVGIGVFENYLQASRELTAETAEHFSIANVLEEYERRYDWADTTEYQAMHVVGAPLVMAPTSDSGVLRFGTMWSKLQNQCSKAKSIKNIQMKRAELGFGSTSVQDISYFRQMVANSLHDPECAKHVFRAIGLDEVGILQTMRLWPCEYKLSTHAKVKRWIS